MRRGVGADLEPLCFQQGFQYQAGTPFSLGAGDVDGGVAVVRIAEGGCQGLHSAEIETFRVVAEGGQSFVVGERCKDLAEFSGAIGYFHTDRFIV